MSIKQFCGLSLLLTAVTLSGCSTLKGKSDSKPSDSGTTTSSAGGATTQGAETGQGLGSEAFGQNAAGKGKARATQEGLTAPEQSRVFFAYDSDDLSEASLALLSRHAAFLQAHPDVQASLEGHTDERGTAEYNLALGERRAKAVAVYLQTHGVKPGQLEVASFGELKPLADGEDEESYARNRRVEILYH